MLSPKVRTNFMNFSNGSFQLLLNVISWTSLLDWYVVSNFWRELWGDFLLRFVIFVKLCYFYTGQWGSERGARGTVMPGALLAEKDNWPLFYILYNYIFFTRSCENRNVPRTPVTLVTTWCRISSFVSLWYKSNGIILSLIFFQLHE